MVLLHLLSPAFFWPRFLSEHIDLNLAWAGTHVQRECACVRGRDEEVLETGGGQEGACLEGEPAQGRLDGAARAETGAPQLQDDGAGAAHLAGDDEMGSLVHLPDIEDVRAEDPSRLAAGQAGPWASSKDEEARRSIPRAFVPTRLARSGWRIQSKILSAAGSACRNQSKILSASWTATRGLGAEEGQLHDVSAQEIQRLRDGPTIVTNGPKSSSVAGRNWPAMATSSLADTPASILHGRPGLRQRFPRVVEARRIGESGTPNPSMILSAECQFPPLKDGTACDDNTTCTVGDAC